MAITRAQCTHCPEPVLAHGLCVKHYTRQRRGTPLLKPDRAPDGESEQIALRCSADQLRAWKQAAKRNRMTLRVYMRAVMDLTEKFKRDWPELVALLERVK